MMIDTSHYGLYISCCEIDKLYSGKGDTHIPHLGIADFGNIG